MINFFANIFGYILKILFDLTGNFGVSIILFTIITKLLLLPLLIKQQKSTKQLAKVQPKLLEIQEKYKDDKERYALEYTKLQQEEHFNPFTGCLIALIQIPIILAMFYIVSKPLTYVEKMPQETITAYVEELQIDQNTARAYPEIEIIKRKPELNIDLNLFGINLGDVPSKDPKNLVLLIIPVLSVLMTLISVKMTSDMQNNMNNNANVDDERMKQTQSQMKMMNYTLPVLSGYIAYQVPLGLGLYWLFSNMLQIVQQYVMNKMMKDEDPKLIEMGADKIE